MHHKLTYSDLYTGQVESKTVSFEEYARRRKWRMMKRVRKYITLPETMFSALQIRAAKYGMKYTDYLRYLIAKDAEFEIKRVGGFKLDPKWRFLNIDRVELEE